MIVIDHSAHCRNRLFEWIMWLSTLLAAITLIAPLTSNIVVVIGSVPVDRALGIKIPCLLAAMVFFTVARFWGLWYNGKWQPYSGYVRALCALACALIWGQLALTSFYTNLFKGTISLGFAPFVGITLGEMLSAYRAISDARKSH